MAPVPQRFYEDVAVGEELGEVVKGPMTAMHIMRWSAAIENWHRIHYDKPFAVEHDGLPDILVNGSWKQHVISQMVKDWAGPGGWAWRIRFQYRGMDVRGDTIIAYGAVTSKEVRQGYGLVRCAIGIKNQAGRVSTEGEATVVLPLRDGPALPYPFDLDLDEA